MKRLKSSRPGICPTFRAKLRWSIFTFPLKPVLQMCEMFVRCQSAHWIWHKATFNVLLHLRFAANAKRVWAIPKRREQRLPALFCLIRITDACKRMAAIELAADQPLSVVELAGRLQENGVNHARLFAAQSLAHARAGEISAARLADGFELFHHSERLAPPAGWETIEAFNAALAGELLDHPGTRYERYGSASELSWRIENPARSDTPLFKLLLEQIIAALKMRVAAIRQVSHPWAAATPQTAILRNWCVITESDGFETWHVHQFGWLSEIYYVQIPDLIAIGNTKEGCLAFGLPDDLAGTDGALGFGEHLVRPYGGMLMTFPSQCYHRTYPHGNGEKRICVAFDLRPE